MTRFQDRTALPQTFRFKWKRSYPKCWLSVLKIAMVNLNEFSAATHALLLGNTISVMPTGRSALPWRKARLGWIFGVAILMLLAVSLKWDWASSLGFPGRQNASQPTSSQLVQSGLDTESASLTIAPGLACDFYIDCDTCARSHGYYRYTN